MPRILKMMLPPEGEEGLWVKLDQSDVEASCEGGGFYIHTQDELKQVKNQAIHDFVISLAQRYIYGGTTPDA
jgi:hypothetical protein